MAKKNQYNRQYPRVAVVDLVVGNMGAGNEVEVDLPMGALLQSVTVQGIEAFNSATTATATVGDGTTTFAAAVSVATIGGKTVTNVPKHYPAGGKLTFSLAETGATATAGRAVATATYVIVGAGDEILG